MSVFFPQRPGIVFDGKVNREIWEPTDGHGDPDKILLLNARGMKSGHRTWKVYMGDIPDVIEDDSPEPPRYVYLDDKALHDIWRSGRFTGQEQQEYWPLDFNNKGHILGNRPNRGRPAYVGESKNCATADLPSKFGTRTYFFKGGPRNPIKIVKGRQPRESIDLDKMKKDLGLGGKLRSPEGAHEVLQNGKKVGIPNFQDPGSHSHSFGVVEPGDPSKEAELFCDPDSSKRRYSSVRSPYDLDEYPVKRTGHDTAYIQSKYLSGLFTPGEQIEELKKLLAARESTVAEKNALMHAMRSQFSTLSSANANLDDAQVALEAAEQRITDLANENADLTLSLNKPGRLIAVQARLEEVVQENFHKDARIAELEHDAKGTQSVSAANARAASRDAALARGWRHAATVMYCSRIDQTNAMAAAMKFLSQKKPEEAHAGLRAAFEKSKVLTGSLPERLKERGLGDGEWRVFQEETRAWVREHPDGDY